MKALALCLILMLSACGVRDTFHVDPETGICYEHYRSWDLGIQDNNSIQPVASEKCQP